MQKIWMVITNCGDGSNAIEMVKDQKVLDKMETLANNGDDVYASGDGLQAKAIEFPDDFDLDTWVKKYFYGYTTYENVDRSAY